MFKDGTKQSDTQKPHDGKYLLQKKHYYYHYMLMTMRQCL